MKKSNHSPFRDMALVDLQPFVATQVVKVSRKPFQSGLKSATVSEVLEHPVTHRPAFRLSEDRSVVEAGQCEPMEG